MMVGLISASRPLFLKGNRYLAEILGDVLKEKIPDHLYKRYQNLDEKEKKEFREIIANQYFMSIELLTEQFKKVDIRWETYKHSKWDDEEDYAYIVCLQHLLTKNKSSRCYPLQ